MLIAKRSAPPVRGFFAVVALVIAAIGPGCLGDSPDPARPFTGVVLALIDTGINPYHDAFVTSQHPGLEAFASQLAMAYSIPTVSVSQTGAYDDRRTSDGALWNGLGNEQLYRFNGTRVIGIELWLESPIPIIEDATVGHGTGVAGVAARAGVDVLLLMVSHFSRFCALQGNTECVAEPNAAAAVQWAADQPWIDVISASLSIPGNPPSGEATSSDGEAFIAATRSAASSGKVVVMSAGNDPAPSSLSAYNGPPWVVAVGGAEGGSRGDNAAASRFPDFVANFTEHVPQAGCVACYNWTQGTSYAAPIVAGTIAQAIHEARVALGHEGGVTSAGCLAAGRTADGRDVCVTNADFRRALNLTAEHFGPTDWDPSNPSAPSNETLATALGSSVPVAVPPAQQGWGYVHAGLAAGVAERALAGNDAVPPGKEATAAWMNAYADARARYWDG